MKRVLILSLACCVSLGLNGCGRTPTSETNAGPPATPAPGAGMVTSADVVKVQAANVTLSAGGNADATVTLSISPNFHVNANPASYPYLIPTEVKAEKIDGLAAGKPVYPAAEKKKFQFAAEPLAVYEGEAQIKLPLLAEKSVAKGALSIPISVRVQACDHEACFPPATLKTTISVEVK